MHVSRRLSCGSWLGLPLRVVLVVYVAAVALSPLGHHDIACHLKSSTHCTTCNVGSSTEASSGVAALSHIHLIDAGGTAGDPCIGADSIPLRASSGRSPPTLD